MITKSQLRDKLDSNNRFTTTFEVPWNETQLSRLYDTVDQQVEGGSLVDIISAKPVAYDFERESVTVEMVLDCSDMLEEAANLGDGE